MALASCHALCSINEDCPLVCNTNSIRKFLNTKWVIRRPNTKKDIQYSIHKRQKYKNK